MITVLLGTEKIGHIDRAVEICIKYKWSIGVYSHCKDFAVKET